MHFLTPHVEISMADNNEQNNNNNNANALRMATTNGTSNDHSASNSQQPTTVTATTSTGLDIQAIVRPLNTNGGSPASPQSADSNSNVPSSSHSSILTNEVQSSRHLIFENAIKPSISLIPIKQVNIVTSTVICGQFFVGHVPIFFFFYLFHLRASLIIIISSKNIYMHIMSMLATLFFIYSWTFFLYVNDISY